MHLRARHPGTSLAGLLFFELIRMLAAAAMILLYRLRWRGGSNVPRTGPLLIVANHQSFLDPPMVGVMCAPRHLDFIARGGLFENPSFARLITALNSIPIKEDGGDVAAMKEALARLAQGKAVLIFPEGSRTHDGNMVGFKRGVSVLVKRANCPVLPVGIDGPFEVWPRARKVPRLFGIRIAGVIGRPIPHDELLRDGPDAALRRLEREVSALADQARAIRGT
jgi:1-acyl-sn-glycerol-3-phosphate acyltransferase